MAGTDSDDNEPPQPTDPLSTRQGARRARAESQETRARARASRQRAVELRDATHVLVALYEAALLQHYNQLALPDSSGVFQQHLETLKAKAQQFGMRCRADDEAPEEMLVRLKAALKKAAPKVRVINREALAHEVTTSAIEGYYRVGL